MVDHAIVEYLKKGIDKGFSVERLRKELSKGGFHIRDIEEAIFVYNQEKKMAPIKALPKVEKKEERKVSEIPAKNLPPQEKIISKGGTRWMKIAGWIGIVLFILGAIGFVFSLMSQDSFVQDTIVSGASPGTDSVSSIQIPGGVYLGIGILLIGLILYVLHFYGYARLGRYVESKSLKFFGWAMVLLPVVVLVWIGVSIVMLLRISGSFSIANAGGIGSQLMILGILWLVFYVYGLILQIVFATGMIKAGKQIKFASLSGIFVLIYLVLNLLFLGFFIYNILNIGGAFANPLAASQALESFSILGYISLGSSAFGLLSMLFGSLALVNASKKFE
jgi:hypothetical protein